MMHAVFRRPVELPSASRESELPDRLSHTHAAVPIPMVVSSDACVGSETMSGQSHTDEEAQYW